MTLSTLGLARPELIWLLALTPLLLALLVLASRARARALRTFGGSFPLTARSSVRLWLKGALLVIAFVAVVIALAGPYVDLRLRGSRRLGVDIVLAVDVSQSMATRDVEPDRLRAARHLAEQLGERMIGSRVSLVLFAGQGTLRYPATTDPRILGEVLDNSGKGIRVQQGSSLAAAMESALSAFPVNVDAGRGRAVVIVSDGEVTLGGPADVATLVARDIKLFAIGVGTPAGGQIPTYDALDGKFTGYLRGPDGVAIVSRLDETALQKLAASANGQYWRYAGDDRVIGEIASQMHGLEAVEPVENAGSVPDEKSQLFVAIAVACVLIERLLSDRRRMPMPEIGRVPKRRGRRVLGIAIGSTVLWAVACGQSAPSAQSANAKFDAGDYQTALAAYRDLQVSLPGAPELSIDAGNALHMLGDHPRALPDYAKAIDIAEPGLRAIAQYDRGNTLYRLDRLEDARDAYREALRLSPDDRDAKFNLELVTAKIDARNAGRPTVQQPGAASASPGASQPPGGSGASGSTGPAGTPDPGSQPGTPTGEQSPPSSDRAPGDPSPGDLRALLDSFRSDLSYDEALRVLEALQGEQRGVAQLLEGPRRATPQNPEY